MGIFKNIAGNLLDWLGVANVPAALTALAGLKGEAGQVIGIGAVDAQGGVTELVAVAKPGGGADSGQNPPQSAGLTTEQVNALDGILKVNAYNQNSGYAAAYAAFCKAFGLAAPDDGGDTGGDNTGGSGGEDSGGGDGEMSNEVKWTDGVAYSYEAVENEYVDTNGAFTAYNGWNRTPYLYCKGAAVLRAVVNDPTSMLGMNNTYNAFYDESKNFVGGFSYDRIDNNTAGAYKDIEIPTDAAYFVASHKAGVIGAGNVATDALGFVPYSEVPV